MKIAFLVSNRPDFVERITNYTGSEPLLMLETGPDGLYREEDLARAADVEALMVANEPVTEQILAACPRVKIVQRFGVGYEKLDLEAAAKRGIPCCNLAGVNKIPVAEHGFMLILALVRNVFPAHEKTHGLDWGGARLVMNNNFELAGKTLGVIGLGNTGFELARRARGFDMQIVYNDIREIEAERIEAVGARFMEKEELMAAADIVSINVNFNPTAANMIDAKMLARMKKDAFLVCCARGGVIDEAALRDALNEERIRGAGIDVFSEEPFPADNPLLKAKNLIMTPHMAGASIESSRRNYEWAFENVSRVLEKGEKPNFVLNGV